MSNEQDARLLQSPDWQGRVVRAIASAIDDYFVQRGSKAP